MKENREVLQQGMDVMNTGTNISRETRQQHQEKIKVVSYPRERNKPKAPE